MRALKRWILSKSTRAKDNTSTESATSQLYLSLPPAPRAFGSAPAQSDGTQILPRIAEQPSQDAEERLQQFGAEAAPQKINNNSCFFQLPAEIRTQIYEAVGIIQFRTDSLPAGHQLSGTNLLLSCTQAYYEARHIVYKNSIIYAMHTMRVKFFRNLSDSLLRTIEIIYLTEAAVSLGEWSKFHAWRNRTYDCVQQRLCDARFHPKTMIFVSNFSRYDCYELGHLDPNMHRSQFHTAMTDFQLALSIITTITAVHFVDLNGGVTCKRVPWPGCFHCRHPRTLPWPNPGEVYRKLSTAEMFELEYVMETGVPDVVSYDRYRADCRFKATRCCTGECDFWVYVNRREPREIRVHVYDGWETFCHAWQGPSLPSASDAESVGPP